MKKIFYSGLAILVIVSASFISVAQIEAQTSGQSDGLQVTLLSKSISSTGPQATGSTMSTSTINANFSIKVKALDGDFVLENAVNRFFSTVTPQAGSKSLRVYYNGRQDSAVESGNVTSSMTFGGNCTMAYPGCFLKKGDEAIVNVNVSIQERDKNGVAYARGLCSVGVGALNAYSDNAGRYITLDFMNGDQNWITPEISGNCGTRSLPIQTLPQPSSQPTTPCISSDLRVGSRGSDVYFLQNFLIKKGYLSADSSTGYFGELTKAALVRYQNQSGLYPTNGIVTGLTRTTINNESGTCAPVAKYFKLRILPQVASTTPKELVIANAGQNENEKDNVSLFNFTLIPETPLTITDLSVRFNKAGSGTAVPAVAYLYSGGSQIASAPIIGNVASFRNIDRSLGNYATSTFYVRVDIRNANDNPSIIWASLINGDVKAKDANGSNVNVVGAVQSNKIEVMRKGLEIMLISKRISIYESPQTHTSTSALTAKFMVRVKAVGGDVTLGLLPSVSPSFAKNSLRMYANGTEVPLIASSTLYTNLNTWTVGSCRYYNCVLPEGSEIELELHADIRGRTSAGVPLGLASCSVGLSALNYSIDGKYHTASFMDRDPNWITPTVAFECAAPNARLDVNREVKTVPAVSSVYYRDLTVGSRGSDVLALQNFLIARGYLASDSATGYFGTVTRGALMVYQTRVGIYPANGYFGNSTKEAVLDPARQLNASMPAITASPSPSYTTSPTYTSTPVASPTNYYYTPTPTPTYSSTPTASPSYTSSPTASPTYYYSPSPSATTSSSPSTTASPTASASATVSATATATATAYPSSTTYSSPDSSASYSPSGSASAFPQRSTVGAVFEALGFYFDSIFR